LSLPGYQNIMVVFQNGDRDMLEEELNFEGVDLVCCEIEDLSTIDAELLDINFSYSISAPLK